MSALQFLFCEIDLHPYSKLWKYGHIPITTISNILCAPSTTHCFFILTCNNKFMLLSDFSHPSPSSSKYCSAIFWLCFVCSTRDQLNHGMYHYSCRQVKNSLALSISFVSALTFLLSWQVIMFYSVYLHLVALWDFFLSCTGDGA